MPFTLRIAFLLALISVLLLYVAPPSSGYLYLLTTETLPRMRSPSGAEAMRKGITASRWSRDWVPLAPAQANRRLSAKNDRTALEQDPSLLLLGRYWYQLVVLYNGGALVLVMGLMAYMLARLSSRRLSSAPIPLLVGLILTFVFIYPFERSAYPPDAESVGVHTTSFMQEVWTAPLGIFAAALLAAFFPFATVDPRPTMYPRFMALLRDLSFFGLALLALAFYLIALKLQIVEHPYRADLMRSGIAAATGYPGR
ncbi:MAG: hypothetical protein KY468_07310 [Armatimonadetes bacterium]|nr:hypothetical protein [Armatimonadota bacterium]